MQLIYDIAFLAFALMYLPYFFLKRKYHKGIFMRFGILPKDLLSSIEGKKVAWVHAVSVGETQAARALVELLRAKYPDVQILFSTVTKAGNELAGKLFKDAKVIYLPFDLSFIVKAVLDKVKPSFLIILETEIWPNLVIACRERNIPVFVVNGRISAGSFKRYLLIKPLLSRLLRSIALLCMQSREDAERIRRLGAPEDKIRVTGNVKFDITHALASADMANLAFLKNGQRLLVAGSTHPGEEAHVIRTYRNLAKRFSSLRLVIAPRHIERTVEVERIIEKFGLRSLRFSSLVANDQRLATNDEVIVLDRIGVLAGLYQFAEIVFIGGSLVPRGGHNVIEAAKFGKPILVGRYTFNFRDVVERFIQKDAILQIGKDDLENALEGLLLDAGRARELGLRAKSIIEENKGAALRSIGYIEEYITKKG